MVEPRSARALASLSVILALVPACVPEGRPQLCAGGSSSGIQACPNASTLTEGIDVSHWQSAIDWTQVHQSGVRFAFIRVSDGVSTRDSRFPANWPASRAAGVFRGPYQYFRPASDPIAQANLLLTMVDDAGGFEIDDLPAVLDIETDGGLSPSTVRQKMLQWLQHVEQATGKKPIIYTSPSWASRLSLDSQMAGYTLWVAHWTYSTGSCPSIPNAWPEWRFWQYSDMGSVSGIGGAVDLDVFDGDETALLDFALDSNLSPPVLDAGAPDASPAPDAETPFDAGTIDAGFIDAEVPDAGFEDAAWTDVGVEEPKPEPPDAGPVVSSGPDAGEEPKPQDLPMESIQPNTPGPGGDDSSSNAGAPFDRPMGGLRAACRAPGE